MTQADLAELWNLAQLLRRRRVRLRLAELIEKAVDRIVDLSEENERLTSGGVNVIKS